jgi:hypothetical protein
MRSSFLRTVSEVTLALALAPLGVVACGGANGTPNQGYSVVQSPLSRNTSPQVASSDLQTLVSNNTTFAFNLYHQIAAGNETDNVFYSPYSVSIALAMTYAGARSSTATQMAGALDFQLPSSTLHPDFDALDLQLASRAHGQAGDNGQPFKLNVVDSLWADKTFTFQKPSSTRSRRTTARVSARSTSRTPPGRRAARSMGGSRTRPRSSSRSSCRRARSTRTPGS